MGGRISRRVELPVERHGGKRMSSWLVVELKFQSLMVKETALGSDAWIQILGLLFTCCVTSVTLLNLSVPQFPNL